MLVAAMMILVVAVAAVFTWRATPQYESQVTMFVSGGASPDDTASAYQGSLLSQQKVKSYAQLLHTQRVTSAVIERLDLDLTPTQLSGKVRTAVIPDTSLLTATVRDQSPQRAQRIADAIGREFVELVPALESFDEDQQPAVKVTLTSPAELPSSPVSPQHVRTLTLAAVLGLLAGFGLAVARQTLDTTVKTPDQMEDISQTPSLAAVPFEAKATKKPLITPSTHTPRAEAYRKLHTNLHFADVDQPHKIILVTSAAPGEGKSVTACNLAIAMAEAGKRVILLDADLRRPTVASYLGLPNGVGLTSILLGDTTTEEATQSWGGHLLTVLTSGPIPPNPTILLGSQRIRSPLEALTLTYDAIIVDSPPTLPVADAPTLAAACHGVIVVARCGKTRHEQLRATLRALHHTGTPILGTVLNQTPHRGNAYYYTYHQKPAPTSRRPHKPADATSR